MALDPTGYYRHLAGLFDGTVQAGLTLDEDEAAAFDPATDTPWTVLENVRLTDG